MKCYWGGIGLLIVCFVTTADASECQVANWKECNVRYPAGCVQPGEAEAKANLVRKALPTERRRAELDVDAFETLQLSTDLQRHRPQGFAVRDRSLLQNREFYAAEGKPLLGELDVVSLVGFIVGNPRPSRPEAETCNAIKIDDNNWRINIASMPAGTEFESVLIVMTPRGRARGWSLEKLRWVERQQWAVRVTGQLFYDSKHRVNSNPDDELTGEPRRLSLWELHPIVGFEVCRFSDVERCRSKTNDHWENLEDLSLPWQ